MIDSKTIRQYHERGYFTLKGLLTTTEVQEICRRITDIVARHPDVPQELIQFEPQVDQARLQGETKELAVRKLARMAVHDEMFRRLAHHPKLLEIATAILGPDIVLMQSMLLMKSPYHSTQKVWHQDNAYFLRTPPEIFGFWIACDLTDVDNGCMHVVPGSHQGGLREHAGLGDEFGLTTAPPPEAVVPIPLESGDALIFHGKLFHHTPPNRTNRRRRAVQYHYAAAHCSRMDSETPYLLDPEFELTAQ